MSTPSYHSALLPKQEVAPPLQHLSIGERGVALCHDLLAGDPFPPEYDTTPVLYMEPPWPAGFAQFNERAGIAGERRYIDLMRRVEWMIEHWPVAVLTGKAMQRYLPAPDAVREVAFWPHRVTARCAFWGMEPPEAQETRVVARELARRYGAIGDPMCGHGMVGREAMREGARFVLSDFDPRCIGRIALEARQW